MQLNRYHLIALAIKYQGEYGRIAKAIKTREVIEEYVCSNAITILDPDYPLKFHQLEEPPFVLFYHGRKELLNDDPAAVIGSRNPCFYAVKATEELCQALKKRHTIVSGMAKGIDATAHKAALDRTVGVLGCGIDYIYPAINQKLFTEVKKNGLLISEYPGFIKPYAYHFPFRNRLIAALCDKLFVMEGKFKSGTMTTVEAGLQLGKEIYVLPFDLYADLANNTLIAEGAVPIDRSSFFEY